MQSSCTTQENNENQEVEESINNDNQEVEESTDPFLNVISTELADVKLPVSLVDNPDTPHDETIVTLRNESYHGMYVIEGSYLYSEHKKDSQLVAYLPIGRAVNVVETNEEWSFVKILFMFGTYYDGSIWSGWIPTSSLGYYEDLESNIHVSVLVKEGYEPESSRNLSQGFWTQIDIEEEETYWLSYAGAGSVKIEKKYIEPFFTKKESE